MHDGQMSVFAGDFHGNFEDTAWKITNVKSKCSK